MFTFFFLFGRGRDLLKGIHAKVYSWRKKVVVHMVGCTSS